VQKNERFRKLKSGYSVDCYHINQGLLNGSEENSSAGCYDEECKGLRKRLTNMEKLLDEKG